MSVVTVVIAVAAAVALIAVGVFSVASLVWGDLLEGHEAPTTSPADDLTTAA